MKKIEFKLNKAEELESYKEGYRYVTLPNGVKMTYHIENIDYGSKSPN